jgi:AcrR family transcriptional regulator
VQLKQDIIKASFELFMRYGIKSVTMDDIARELGISKKTLYQYVSNKAELIEQIFQAHVSEEKCMTEEIRSTSSDALEEMLRIGRYVVEKLRSMSPTTVYDLRKYYGTIWKRMESQMKQHVYGVISDNIERGIRQGIYRSELNPEIIARLYVGKSVLVADEDVFESGKYDLATLHQEYIRYHIHGIASEKGRQLLAKHLAAEEQEQ